MERSGQDARWGQAALRTAGIIKTLEELGHNVTDTGNISPDVGCAHAHKNKGL